MLLDGPEVDQLNLGSTRSGQSALVVPVTLGEEMQAFIYFPCNKKIPLFHVLNKDSFDCAESEFCHPLSRHAIITLTVLTAIASAAKESESALSLNHNLLGCSYLSTKSRPVIVG